VERRHVPPPRDAVVRRDEDLDLDLFDPERAFVEPKDALHGGGTALYRALWEVRAVMLREEVGDRFEIALEEEDGVRAPQKIGGRFGHGFLLDAEGGA
jgi:hypothetical protein